MVDYSIIRSVNKRNFYFMISSISQITQLWDRSLRKIEEQLGEKQLFDSFFAGSYIYEVKGDTITVMVNSALAKSLIRTKYMDLVTSVVNEVTQSNFKLDFVIEADVKGREQVVEAPVQKKQQYFQSAVLNTNLTFDNFVVGSFNREASQAALLITSLKRKNLTLRSCTLPQMILWKSTSDMFAARKNHSH